MSPKTSANQDLPGFIQYLIAQNCPAIAALIGNAYDLQISGAQIVLYLDSNNANLIPLLKSQDNAQALKTHATGFFRKLVEVHYKVGQDPSIQMKRNQEEEDLQMVKATQQVKFLLEHFDGTIINCQRIKKGKKP